MKFTVIDRSKAPEPPRPGASKNVAVYDRLVAALEPGKVARIEPDPNETPRGIKTSLARAAKRAGRQLRSWDHGNVVYVELVEALPSADDWDPVAEAATTPGDPREI